MKSAPNGGYIASILDAEGFPVSFVWGQSPAEPREMPERLAVNDEKEKPRVRKFVRFSPGPAAIHKVSWFLGSRSQGQLADFFLLLLPSSVTMA